MKIADERMKHVKCVIPDLFRYPLKIVLLISGCRNKSGMTGLILFLFLLNSCASIKGFEKMYLGNEEMRLSEKAIEHFEISVETYREGASGANGGQTGGGCGCH